MSKRIDQLLARMTLDEKIGQLNLQRPAGIQATGTYVNQDTEEHIRKGRIGGISGGTPDAIPYLQKMAVEETRLGIPLIFYWNVIHGYRLTFPLPLAMACTWDIDLYEETTRIAATEAASAGFQWAAAPVGDIARNPKWGRIAETFGPDPYLASELTAAAVRGFQKGDVSDPTALVACIKHMAGYGASEDGLDYDEVNIHPQQMLDVYLKPFMRAIQDAPPQEKALCVMMAFNAVAGRPLTCDHEMIEMVLRRKFGFTGFTVSDYDSVPEIIKHGIGDIEDATEKSIKAGLDMELAGQAYLNNLKKLVADGRVDPKLIDQACRRILEIKEKLGLFDNPYRGMDQRYKQAVHDDMPAYRQKAREAAAKSCVLLKNENNVLPLKDGEIIALIGPLADDRANVLGTWSIAGRVDETVSLLDGLKNTLGSRSRIIHCKGANITDDPEEARRANIHGVTAPIDPDMKKMIADARRAARKCDKIVLALGEAREMSGESSSKTDIRFPESQRRLYRAMKKIAAETGKPLIVVGMSGRPNDIIEELEGSDAYLMSIFAGNESGNGIADILTGRVNPSGRLPFALQRSAAQNVTHIGKRPSGRPMPDNVEWAKFHRCWLDEKMTPLRPFGFGLSYSAVEYGPVRCDKTQLSGENDRLNVSLEIENTSLRPCVENVQLYMYDPACSDLSRTWELKRHRLVPLAAGEKKTVTFSINAKDLEYIAARTLSNYKVKWEAGAFVIGVGKNFDALECKTVQWDRPDSQMSFKIVQKSSGGPALTL